MVLNRSSLSLQESIEDLLGEVDVALADLVVESLVFLLELVDVGFQEVIFGGVEIVNEVVAPLDGDRVIDLGVSHVRSSSSSTTILAVS